MNQFLGNEHFIFTPENPHGPMKFGSNPKIEDVTSFLNHNGENAEIVEGHCGKPERSILVRNPKNVAGLHQMASDFGQESAIHSKDGKHEMHFYHGPQAGQVVNGEGTDFYKEMPEDNWTKIHTKEGPLYFRHNFLVNESEDLSKAEGLIPNQNIRNVADQYASSKGLTLKHGEAPVKVDKIRAAKIADAYHEMPHNPNHPEVKRAYKALTGETMDQFNHIKNSGLKISRMKTGQANPYKSSADLFHDIKHNNHMWYYPTESGYGNSNSNTIHHPLLATVGEHEGQPLLANDVFRIVHDYFGHAKEGHGFGPNGEENAWRNHMQMYSPEAQKALTSETRGQNSWVNFGPHGESNRMNPAATVYADQKAGLLPDWAIDYDNAFGKSEEPLTKMKAGPSAKSSIQPRPKQIKLMDKGPNKGRVVDVVNSQDTHEGEPAIAIKVPRGQAPLKHKTTGGGDIDANPGTVLKWNKERPHKVVQEARDYEPGKPEGRIAESKDTHKFLTHSPKQKELVHGVNLTQVTPSGDGWTSDWAVSGFSKNAKGQKVYVKGMMPHEVIDDEDFGDEYKELSTPQREALYHNLAHMMGMGHYVPTTSVVKDPENGTNYSVMKVIPNAEHFNGSQKHTRILDDLKRSGEIDKLALMNTLLGNTDRHGGNYMLSPKGLHMIDHGLAFDWHGKSGRDIYLPNYYKKAYSEDEDSESDSGDTADQPVHPEAVKWLANLDVNQMKDFFRKHAKVPAHIEKPFVRALQDAQRMVKSKKGKVRMDELRQHIRNTLEDENLHDSNPPASSPTGRSPG